MLKEKYQKEIVPILMRKLGYKNPMAVPKLEKIVVNSGIGKILGEIDPDKRKEFLDQFAFEIALICGQKPKITCARKSISGFGVKKGMPVGLMVTLRGKRMYHFLERLINYALPRKRDFQGISQKSIDKNGNLTIGFKEHLVFPEIKPEEVKRIIGLEVTLCPRAKNREEAILLYQLLGIPFKKE